MVKRRVTLTVEDGVLNDFRVYCKDHAFNMSAKVELLMKQAMVSKRGNRSLFEFLRPERGHAPVESPIQIIRRMVRNPKTVVSTNTPTIDKLRRLRGI